MNLNKPIIIQSEILLGLTFKKLSSFTKGSVCSTPKRSVGILSSPGTSCAYKEPEKMLCKQGLLNYWIAEP